MAASASAAVQPAQPHGSKSHHVNRPDRSTIRLNRSPSTTTYSITRIRSHVRTVGIFIRSRLLNQTGKPIKNARIEIWQANAYGATTIRDRQFELPLDPNFSPLAIPSRNRRDTIASEHQTRTLFGQLGMATAAAYSFRGHSRGRYTMADTNVLCRRGAKQT